MSLCKHIAVLDSPLRIAQELDHIEWKIESALNEGKIDQNFITNVTLDKITCGLFFKIIPDNTRIAPADDQYIKDKLFRLNQKIATLVPIKTIVAPGLLNIDPLPELSGSPGLIFEAVISKMIEFLAKNDDVNFKKAMSVLPVQTQNEMYRKHWEMMGSPTKTSSDSYLRSIAHSDFGRVSLLGLESRCDVSSAKKIQTLQTFMAIK